MLRDKLVSYVSSVEPVTLAQVKEQLRITTTADDTYLNELISIARETLELRLGRAIISQNRTCSFDIFRQNDPYWDGVRDGSILVFTPAPMRLPMPPVQSITQMRTYDIGNVSAVYSAASYRLDDSDPLQFSRLIFNYGAVWPTQLRTYNSVEVDYLAGYVDGTVPKALSQAIRSLVAYCYANRAPCTDGCISACGLNESISLYEMKRAAV
jgi:uncharacterized phiE125 gp8 family phage protein